MPLPISVDKIDSVPEAARGAYVERDGKFVLDAEIEDTTGLKNTVSTTRKERDEAAKRAKQLETELAEIKRQQEAAASGVTAEKLKEIEAGIQKKYEPYITKSQELENELNQLRKSQDLRVAMGKAGVRPERMDALERLIGDRVDLTDDKKSFVKDNASVALDAYLADAVKKEFPEFYAGTQASGGGAAGQQQAGSGGSAKPPTQWSSEERQAYIEAHGAEAYLTALTNYQVEAATAKKAAA